MVHLAGGKNVVVDAKVSLGAFLEAAEAAGRRRPGRRRMRRARQAAAGHVDRLASRGYWKRLRCGAPTPEFVVLFVPGEAFLVARAEREPGAPRVRDRPERVLATPTTLITLLRTVAYAWQQQALSPPNAHGVFDLGRELYDRIGVFSRHVDAVGRSLAGAVAAYNRAVGSLESRVTGQRRAS